MIKSYLNKICDIKVAMKKKLLAIYIRYKETNLKQNKIITSASLLSS